MTTTTAATPSAINHEDEIVATPWGTTDDILNSMAGPPPYTPSVQEQYTSGNTNDNGTIYYASGEPVLPSNSVTPSAPIEDYPKTQQV
eukprot:CAMPEP_0116833492 /NCGR_PEP_ID=MMETSP0418-20121206/6467_1 /TAXON_ID=1158023 /ORGANISM="Astrosyne radiata, Strain 13vi08-1A" /LENGTH=87 /DNA_ID=CAMNT_0004462949 /DNA_START=468 /DNA_END=731 /DNA_ORIENTATION=-